MKEKLEMRKEGCGDKMEPSNSKCWFYAVYVISLAVTLSACASTQTRMRAEQPEPSHFELEINDGSRPWNDTDWLLWMNRFGGGP